MIGTPPFGKEQKPWGSAIDSDRTIFFGTLEIITNHLLVEQWHYFGGAKNQRPPLHCHDGTRGAPGGDPRQQRAHGAPGLRPGDPGVGALDAGVGLLRPAYGMDHHHFEGHGNHGTHGMGSG